MRIDARLPILALLMLVLAGSVAHGSLTPDAEAPPPERPTAVPKRILISGHSLTNRPFPDHLARFAEQRGGLSWNMQYLEGSTIKARTFGSPAAPWSGYRAGRDRDGRPIDALKELALKDNAAGNAIPYDALIITEQDSLLESLIWNDTIRFVVDYDERLRQANPSATTYLFSSWLHLSDRSAPERWIGYEQTAAKAWRCTALQINRHLARSGRQVRLIPAAEALASLVEEAVSGDGISGLPRNSAEAAVRAIFVDDVHLTDLGSFYVALIAYASVFDHLPAPDPDTGIDLDLQHALVKHASRFLEDWRERQAPRYTECRKFMSSEYTPAYLAYVRDTSWSRGGALKANLNWLRYSFLWPRLLRSSSPRNPFAPVPTDES